MRLVSVLRSVSVASLSLASLALVACSGAPDESPATSSADALSAGSALETWNGVTAHVYGGVCADVYASSGSNVHYGPPGILTDTCGYQCVELAVRYFNFNEGIPASGWHVGAAIDMCGSHPAGVVETSSPVVGDLMIYNPNDPYYGTGSAGHVAVIRGINANGSLNVFNQRWGNETTAFVNGIVRSHAACFLHSVHNTVHGADGVGNAAGNCTTAEYDGQAVGIGSFWTCQGNSRYVCDGKDHKVVESCPSGCTSEGVGADDQCNGGGGPTCTSAEYAAQNLNNNSYWTCQGNARFMCDGKGYKITESCPNGCISEGNGVDDQCR